MNINEAFPSKYLKASDLQGGTVTVKIDRVEMEMMGDDRKMVVYFQGKQKGLVTNKTNANNIAALYGDDTDDWTRSEIMLVRGDGGFPGQVRPGDPRQGAGQGEACRAPSLR
jgi:hypothetical protein